MRRPLLALMLAGLLIAALAPTTLATTTRIQYTDSAALIVTDPGVATTNGLILSVRGETEYGVISGGPVVGGKNLVAGTETPVVNYDINVLTGEGVLWGKDTIEPADFPDGHWDCSLRGTFLPATFDPATGFEGSINSFVCHGDGSLTGWQGRGIVTVLSPGSGTGAGYVFLPGDRH